MDPFLAAVNQLFTGDVPFANMTMPAVLMGVVHEGQRPDTSTDQPPEYASLRDRCWDPDPDKRFLPFAQAFKPALPPLPDGMTGCPGRSINVPH